MRFVLATENAHKLAEFRRILAPHEVVPLPAGIELPEEGVTSFADNARAKAMAVAPALRAGELAIADDSGLEVEALGGGPGVTSSRYAGPAADDRANYERLLRELAPYPDPEQRRARFVCSLACVDRDGGAIEVRGEWPGTIVAAPRGDGGFGYDPVVLPDGSERTVAELTEAEKDRESHRARAAQALLARLAAGGAA